MQFETDLDSRLWAAIRSTHEAGNHTGAIVASIQLLSDVIRNKSGLESDGQTLAGQAFGGPNPIIKLNSLRTESEINEQKGVELLLRGIYTGIRNPRSHDLREDSAETAKAIIPFIDWLLRLIDGSKSPFDPSDIIERVLDDHFVPSTKYSSLIAAEVPPRIRLDVLIRLLDRTTFVKARNSKIFVETMLPLLTENERKLFWETISDKLRDNSVDAEAIVLVRIASVNWLECSEVARLRMEHRLIKSIQEGKVEKNKVQKGWPGVRAIDIEQSMAMKDELHKALLAKLNSWDGNDRAYLYRYFVPTLKRLEPIPSEGIIITIRSLLKIQDADTYWALDFIKEIEETDPWRIAFKDAHDDFEFKDNDIPF